MLAIGLILVVVAAGGGAYLGWIAMQSSTSVPLSGGGVSFGVLPITLLAAGAVAVLLLWVGFRLAAVGFRRRRSQRRELKELRSSGGPPSTVRSTVDDERAGLGRGRPSGRPTDVGLERKVDPKA